MNKYFTALTMAFVVLCYSILPACAEPYEFLSDAHFSKKVRIEGAVTTTGGITQTGNSAISGNQTVGGTLGVTGATTLSSTLNVTGAVTLTAPLTAANIQTGSTKRELLTIKACPAGGAAAANTTVYFQLVYPGRACTVKQITYSTNVDTVSGTNTIKVLKGSSAGNTMLSVASVSLNGTTINTATVATLTATSADLQLTAGQPIYGEFSAGTMGAAAKDVTITVEVEPTDF